MTLTLSRLNRRQTPWSRPNAWPALKQRPDSVKPRKTCKRQKQLCEICNITCNLCLRSFRLPMSVHQAPLRLSPVGERIRPPTSLMPNSSPLSSISAYTNLGNRNTLLCSRHRPSRLYYPSRSSPVHKWKTLILHYVSNKLPISRGSRGGA